MPCVIQSEPDKRNEKLVRFRVHKKNAHGCIHELIIAQWDISDKEEDAVVIDE